MKLPAVAVTAAFACGILLGSRGSFSAHPSPLWHGPAELRGLFVLAVLALAIGLALLSRGRLRSAGALAIIFWTFLGAIAGQSALTSPPAHHVLTLIDAGRIPLDSPLRWTGRLLDEPRELPWGQGLEVSLYSVEVSGETIPLTGGMRVTFPAEARAAAPLPDIHAGDEVAFLTQARLPQLYRDPGAFNRREHLAQQGIHLTATLRAPELIERLSQAPPSLLTFTARTRARLRKTLSELFPAAPEAAALLRAMLLGDSSFVDRDASRNFQITGTYHVLVIAGLHVTALAVFLFWAGRAMRLPRNAVSLLALALLLAYVGVVEQRPPVVRAALMAAIVVLGGMLYRRLNLLNSAALAALLILAARPLELYNSSFQLSFLAMACIGGIAIPWIERTAAPYSRALRAWRDVTADSAHEPPQAQFRLDLRALDAWLAARLPARAARWSGNGGVFLLAGLFRSWDLLVLSFVLQVGMLPLMAQEFHRVSLAGPLANLFIVPLTGLLVPLGFLTLGSALLWAPLARTLAWPLVALTSLLTHLAAWFAAIPHGSYRIPAPPAWAMLAFFAAFATLAIIRWKPARITAAAVLLASAAIIATYPFAPALHPGNLEMTALDVGQGDAILLVSPQGRTMLIDGGGSFAGGPMAEAARARGPEPGEDAVSPYLWSRGIQRLDIVALTHAHQDHIGGLRAILDNFQVGQLWLGREITARAQAALEEQARQRKIPIEHERSGNTSDWGGAQMQVLWPEATDSAPATEAQNNDSLVLRLSYGHRAFLLPGDIERQAEAHLLEQTNNVNLAADVLKAGHHGSRNSTTDDFLARVHPQLAIISAGSENPYGHPSAELLARLNAAHVRILRTDRNGAIQVLTNGENLEVSCFAGCADEGNRQPR